jgi:hypothetical protein
MVGGVTMKSKACSLMSSKNDIKAIVGLRYKGSTVWKINEIIKLNEIN